MAEPRYRRRKEERPAEITQAAMETFAEHGYAAARIDDVAKRAGISKGLLYLYFKTKEELFKAVIRSVVVPRIDALKTAITDSDLSAEEIAGLARAHRRPPACRRRAEASGSHRLLLRAGCIRWHGFASTAHQ
jgi:AcrR family transcriptional regulator